MASWNLWFRGANRDNEVFARDVAGVSDIVKVPGTANADVSCDHAAGDAVSCQLADASADKPDLVVKMVTDGFVRRAGFLARLVHFNLNISSF